MNTLSLITGALVQRLASASVQAQGEGRSQEPLFMLPEAAHAALREQLQTLTESREEHKPGEKQAKPARQDETVPQALETLMTVLLMPERPAAVQMAQPVISTPLAQGALPGQVAAATPKQLAEQVRLTADTLPAIASLGGQAEPLRPERPAALRHAVPAVNEKRLHDRPEPASPAANSAFIANDTRLLAGKMPPERTIGVDTRSAQWGEALIHMLKENIHFQLSQQQQVSTIRLDPPSLGKLEIAIQLEAGKLTVHIGASQADVCRTLQQCGDALRTQLTQQNFVQVEVQVSPDGQSGSHSRRQRDNRQTPSQIVTAIELDTEEVGLKSRDSVLIKV
nr:flagellar hook-length control protein FliK [Pseudescherichia sp.]